MGQIFFDEEPIYEISKPYLKFLTDGRTHASTHGRTSPKQYAPLTFSKLEYKDCLSGPMQLLTDPPCCGDCDLLAGDLDLPFIVDLDLDLDLILLIGDLDLDLILLIGDLDLDLILLLGDLDLDLILLTGDLDRDRKLYTGDDPIKLYTGDIGPLLITGEKDEGDTGDQLLLIGDLDLLLPIICMYKHTCIS